MPIAAVTLEEHLGRIAELVEANRAVNWEIGDQAAEIIREHGRGALGKIAEVCGWSRSQVLMAIRLSHAFPPGGRWPDVRRQWYVEALRAAERLEKDPAEVLEEALEKGLSAAQIRRLGRENGKALLRTSCPCGVRVRIEGPGELGGTPIRCPACGTEMGVMALGG